MTLGKRTPDKTLLKNVLRKMAQKCTGSQRVSATVQSSDVTVTGTIKYEHERRPILRCIAAVPGIGRVVDQIRLEAKKPNN